jgi:hypothetical protein
VSTRQDDLWAAGGLLDPHHIHLEALAGVVTLAGDLLGGKQDTSSLAEVDVGDVALNALDVTIEDETLFVLVFGEDDLTLGFAQALDDDLLGSLGGDATEVLRVGLHLNEIGLFLGTDVSVLVELLGIL